MALAEIFVENDILLFVCFYGDESIEGKKDKTHHEEDKKLDALQMIQEFSDDDFFHYFTSHLSSKILHRPE
jgi:hypothetical protein